MRAPNPPALWPLCLPFHSVKGFQLSLGLFIATCLALQRPQCLSSSRGAPVFPCVAKAMACKTQGCQNGAHVREISSKSVLLKTFYSTMLWAPVMVQEEDMFCLHGHRAEKHGGIRSERNLFEVVLLVVCLTWDTQLFKILDFFPSFQDRVTFLALLCCCINEGKCLMSSLVFNDSPWVTKSTACMLDTIVWVCLRLQFDSQRCCRSQMFFDIHEQLPVVDVTNSTHFHLNPMALPQVSPAYRPSNTSQGLHIMLHSVVLKRPKPRLFISNKWRHQAPELLSKISVLFMSKQPHKINDI